MSKYRIWSTYSPALWGSPTGVKVVAGTITKLMQGRRQLDPTAPLPKGTTLAEFEWVRPVRKVFQPTVRRVEGSNGKTYIIKSTPSGKWECTCTGYSFRRTCKHIKGV